MPSADFCAALTSLAVPLCPGVPGTAQTSRGKTTRLIYHPGPCWLRTSRPLARSSDRAGLVSGSCPSGRGFAPRFLQIPPRDDALALRQSFAAIKLDRGLPPPSWWPCSAHQKRGQPEGHPLAYSVTCERLLRLVRAEGTHVAASHGVVTFPHGARDTEGAGCRPGCLAEIWITVF